MSYYDMAFKVMPGLEYMGEVMGILEAVCFYSNLIPFLNLNQWLLVSARGRHCDLKTIIKAPYYLMFCDEMS